MTLSHADKVRLKVNGKHDYPYLLATWFALLESEQEKTQPGLQFEEFSANLIDQAGISTTKTLSMLKKLQSFGMIKRRRNTLRNGSNCATSFWIIRDVKDAQ